MHVHPGALIADIDHFNKTFVKAGLPVCILKERFMGPGGAGGHHNAIEFVLDDSIPNQDLCVLGAGVEIILYRDNIRERLCIFLYFMYIYNPSDIVAAMTYEHPNFR